ncbi:conserved hypothetical protein [Candidatus Xenohaliotis californiensis]|uniref:DUF2497 domain-containing protein n=1 Tax=Candidatus Xenohaliotis californiensis TaxID=84677 RepID=A0ABP0EUB2_9RICK|nr:conserved hypothetical protein [Candidatus Xenohaliotis californiensis]
MADIFKSIRSTVPANNQKNSGSDILELTEPVSGIKQQSTGNHNDSNINDSSIDNIFYDDNQISHNDMVNSYQQTAGNRSSIAKNHPKSNANSSNDSSIISTNSAKETVNEIGSLLRTINNKRNKKIHKGTTIEDLVIEAIKPYLANWINDNLPDLVKNIVEKEIKKLILEGL